MNYQQLPDDTRIWIYQANRQLSDNEVSSIREFAEEFVNIWTAHGAKLKAAVEVFHKQFVIVFADEKQAKASGCSIDKSVRFIKQIEIQLKITLLDRNLITYKVGDNIITCTRKEFSNLAENKRITADTLVFNNLITTKGEINSNWLVPLKDSWHTELSKT
jgi:sRNA-binding regulator protein Hfq